jgi:hypothetical protein
VEMKRRVSLESHSKNLVELLKKNLVGSFKIKINKNEKRYDR